MKFKLKILITLIQLSCIFPAIGQEKLLLAGSCNTSIMIVNKENGSIEWQHTVEPYGTEYRKQVDEGMRKENVIG